uniref:Secreted protein n=1 Tax=Strongyloides stercoralis TaxID=6248 RepID=A0A0K0E754_STRER
MIFKKYYYSIFLLIFLVNLIKSSGVYSQEGINLKEKKGNSISSNILLACRNNPQLYMCSKIKNYDNNSEKLNYLKNILIYSSIKKNKELNKVNIINNNDEMNIKLSENTFKCFYENFASICGRKRCYCLDSNDYSKKICESWFNECYDDEEKSIKRRKQQTFRQMDTKLNDDQSKPIQLSLLKDFSSFKARDQTDVHNDLSSMGNFHKFDSLTDQTGVLHRARSRSPWVKPGLWEANPDNPHNRDHANKWFYFPQSTTADWLSGQVYWGGHWAVPAASVGGTNGFSAVHFPSLGSFLGIDDDYD